MDLYEFQPGDRVRYFGHFGDLNRRYGIVIGCLTSHYVLVEFDEPFRCGHDGWGKNGLPRCRKGHGWYVLSGELELISSAECEQEEDLGSLMKLLE